LPTSSAAAVEVVHGKPALQLRLARCCRPDSHREARWPVSAAWGPIRRARGQRSPTRAFSDLFNADASLVAGARDQVSTEHIERAAYVVGGQVEIEGQTGSFTKHQLIVFKLGAEIILKASGARGS
jgi:redox-sensitive bicupin YhaK (pirin superfamily)